MPAGGYYMARRVGGSCEAPVGGCYGRHCAPSCYAAPVPVAKGALGGVTFPEGALSMRTGHIPVPAAMRQSESQQSLSSTGGGQALRAYTPPLRRSVAAAAAAPVYCTPAASRNASCSSLPPPETARPLGLLPPTLLSPAVAATESPGRFQEWAVPRGVQTPRRPEHGQAAGRRATPVPSGPGTGAVAGQYSPVPNLLATGSGGMRMARTLGCPRTTSSPLLLPPGAAAVRGSGSNSPTLVGTAGNSAAATPASGSPPPARLPWMRAEPKRPQPASVRHRLLEVHTALGEAQSQLEAARGAGLLPPRRAAMARRLLREASGQIRGACDLLQDEPGGSGNMLAGEEATASTTVSLGGSPMMLSSIVASPTSVDLDQAIASTPEGTARWPTTATPSGPLAMTEGLLCHTDSWTVSPTSFDSSVHAGSASCDTETADRFAVEVAGQYFSVLPAVHAMESTILEDMLGQVVCVPQGWDVLDSAAPYFDEAVQELASLGWGAAALCAKGPAGVLSSYRTRLYQLDGEPGMRIAGKAHAVRALDESGRTFEFALRNVLCSRLVICRSSAKSESLQASVEATASLSAFRGLLPCEELEAATENGHMDAAARHAQQQDGFSLTLGGRVYSVLPSALPDDALVQHEMLGQEVQVPFGWEVWSTDVEDFSNTLAELASFPWGARCLCVRNPHGGFSSFRTTSFTDGSRHAVAGECVAADSSMVSVVDETAGIYRFVDKCVLGGRLVIRRS